MKLADSKYMVLKIGSALLVDEAKAAVNREWLASLIEDIVDLMQRGTKVVLVTSGAIATGKIALGIHEKHLALDTKQALAAVGQIQLSQLYQTLLHEKNFTAAQVLLTINDTEDRGRYVNLSNTLHKLLQMNIVPIINENDSVATSEIRYGDNDRLAARVAQMVAADTLVLLSDIDGLYTDDPRKAHAAKFIAEVPELTPEILNLGKNSSSNYGTGGMISKLAAAQIATSNGCRMLITAGKHKHPLRYFNEHGIGTWFHAVDTPQNAKKRWLAQHLKSAGSLVIDQGAVIALAKGASLLPVGIKQVIGQFQKGSAITIVDLEQKPLAKGLSNYASDELQKIIGKKTAEITEALQYEGCAEVVHRDNLVLL